MHIAWLGKKSPFCGNVTYGREITNALLNREHQVSFLHFDRSESNYENWPNCAEIRLPFFYKSQIYTIPTLKSHDILIEALEKLKPDIVHASLILSPLDFQLPEICRKLNLPLVATFHPGFDQKLRNLKSIIQFIGYKLYATCLKNYDKIIVFSNVQKNLLVKFGVNKDKIAIIPNGVDEKKYSPGKSDFKNNLDTKNLFLYLGRISTEKNIDSLLKAWKDCKLGEDSRLLIVGSGHLENHLKKYYTIEDGIIWYGFVGLEEKRIEILRAADVFILPSLVEGLSLSLLEAMACGVACIATDAGADGEVLDKGAGVIMDTHNVTTQLKNLLPLFRDHPEFHQILGQKARERILERYTLNNNITKLEKLYMEVFAKKHYQVIDYYHKESDNE